jgi:hypothetical protein
MERSFRSSRLRGRVVVIATVAAACAAVACVLADPPPDLPAESQLHPVVVQSAVFPPTTQVLVELPPSGFVVPVQLFDPDTPFEYEVFVDFDPSATPPQSPVIAVTVAPPFPLDGGVDLVDFDLTPYFAGLDPSVCHEIDFVVALGFTATSPHTPDSRGGDGVLWFYDASGGLGGCPGVEGGVVDTGTGDARADANDGDAAEGGDP